ncbi:MAG TPA: glycerol kinase GlpK [Polyangia bacterium]|nr:glycerol kinase GlpK [Polyangia bacterium]HVZ89194.1 glycerol kinase GlpK [Polyangia bacterium]
MQPDLVIAIDQGTTGTTVLVVDATRAVRGRGYREFAQIYPRPGEVEHDPEAIWASVTGALGDALVGVDVRRIAALGITNQRETTLLWERDGGRPVANAIVWQDRRTAPLCAALKAAGHEPAVRQRTGLVLDPYFSATKIRWLLDNVGGLRARAEAGALAFGTVDSFLIWRLTGGKTHVTDVTNASRTLLFDLHARRFSDELCALFGVPRALLPEVRPSAGRLGETRGVPGLPDGIPIAGVAGDQQAALFGQDCTEAGDAKCTFGTGAFLLMNVGAEPRPSTHGLLTTVAWTLEAGGAASTAYALEGSAFVAGALVQWLRDGLGLIASAPEIEPLARSVPDAGGVTIVPALTGLGAPHWRAEARGLIAGVTRGTTRAHLARAALEAIALQNVDLVSAMQADAGRSINHLRVDGGAAANDLLMQIQADLLGVQIFRPEMVESTALGAAKLAALAVGLPPPAAGSETARIRVFTPAMPAEVRQAHLARWASAVGRA